MNRSELEVGYKELGGVGLDYHPDKERQGGCRNLESAGEGWEKQQGDIGSDRKFCCRKRSEGPRYHLQH